ncbi:uncharacterized protein JCM10292_007353 [Rhodotorula paludigena]|uniref:uncharacterized protein n=1 Tax=Rhodotorula paludigena TaxID=86838 RepID=UPI00316B63D8
MATGGPPASLIALEADAASASAPSRPYTSAWQFLQQALSYPIVQSTRSPSVNEVQRCVPLESLAPMNDYLDRLMRATGQEYDARDREGPRAAPIRLPAPLIPQETVLDDLATLELLYSTEENLVIALSKALNSRVAIMLTNTLDKRVVLQALGDRMSIAVLGASGVDHALPRITIVVKPKWILSAEDFANIAAVIGKGQVAFVWPTVETAICEALDGSEKKEVKLSMKPWGAYRGETKLGDSDNWRDVYDLIIFQIHCQLVLAKAAASDTESPDILDPLQVDRMCALLTNGEQWLVYSEQDGAGCVAPYVLDGAKHAIAALLTALFLGVMTAPSAKMTLPKSAGRDATSTSPTSSEREPKRLKMEQVVRFLEDAVPRCSAPSFARLPG